MSNHLKLMFYGFVVTTLTKIFIVVCRDQISVMNTEVDAAKLMAWLTKELK